jgi:hypothetical protein
MAASISSSLQIERELSSSHRPIEREGRILGYWG